MKRYLSVFILLIFLLSSALTQAQETDYENGTEYTLGGLQITGLKSYNEQTVISFTNLRIGQKIKVPGKDISDVIKKLWKLDLFSNVNFYITKVEGDKVFLELALQELPTLADVKVTGIKKRKVDDLLKEADIKKGKKVTEGFLANTKNFLVNKYKKKGYYKVKVNIRTVEDTVAASAVKMLVNIDKGDKVKVADINFNGNEKISDKKLRGAMKKTKERRFLRFWKKSKFIPEDYKTDLTSIVDEYKSKGYRDARLLNDSVSYNDKNNTIDINIDVEEGDKYYFGNIDFVGNTVYTDEYLSRILGVKKGETYNGVELRKRIDDPKDPDANSITNLYQNNGYLFSSINPVEISAQNDTIDFEIRIQEGKLAHFEHITVHGNDKTNDHVIYRMLRTRPGQTYSKAAIIQTIRELGSLGFFDAESIKPEIKDPNQVEGTVGIDYSVVEKGSSQIQLQGGYGGGGFIGTVGLSFNNFSIKNLFNGDAYKPVPMGDGQTLALRLQASKYYQTYSFSFSEPWLGGVEPRQFSVSLSHTKQFLYDYYTGDVDKSQRFSLTGITVGISKRLQWPDDYFNLSHAISLQRYDLNNYNTGLFTFGNGYSNNLSYTIALSRNSTGPGQIYPRYGSSFSISAKITPPYTLFSNKDFKGLRSEREDLVNENTTLNAQNANGEYSNQISNNSDRIGEIDQQFYDWLEFYKFKFNGDWFKTLDRADKLVLRTHAEFGFLGAYNQDRGVVPFERFFLGGDGMANYSLDSREVVGLRGYPNYSLSGQDGSTIYNKFSLELRYPLTLKPQASIYAQGFLEGGAAYDSFQNYNPFQLKRSAGLGVRIFMPAFGLLGIDFGYGFDPVDGVDPTNKAHGWETHFIIGQNF
ncbi:outer membrane protein assembly factor BamA [Zhouia sp. PK063]|uniref:outer membrane protein assembly factor BamA n=1 Tax=Zhouia sp. PK063 TaxID=3373602 RepID=UPI0037A8BFD1